MRSGGEMRAAELFSPAVPAFTTAPQELHRPEVTSAAVPLSVSSPPHREVSVVAWRSRWEVFELF